MAIDNFSASDSARISIEALQTTKDACGWLIAIAERSDDPDAAVAARWLEALGERSYLVLQAFAEHAGRLAKGTASATSLRWLTACGCGRGVLTFILPSQMPGRFTDVAAFLDVKSSGERRGNATHTMPLTSGCFQLRIIVA
jgi:hypothetical protein